ncbi:MAG: M3 family peptidase, partial [Kiritimatiellae bacterium]|nr:M3 family peptidase [Kiritimatiellia bacterium]
MSETGFPKWNAFTPEAAAARLPRLLADAETAVAAIEAARPATYEALVWALDDATEELWHCWGRVAHMVSVMNSDAWRRLEESFQPQVVAFSLRVGQSKPIYDAAKALAARETEPTRRRILDKMVESAALAGVALEGDRKDRFNAIQAELAKLATDFSNAVLDATKAFSFEKDGTTYTIDDANYPQTMKHCADRAVREALCRARSTRAPENTARIARILEL